MHIQFTNRQGRDEIHVIRSTFQHGTDLFHTIHVPNFGFRVIRQDIAPDDTHCATGTDVTDQKW